MVVAIDVPEVTPVPLSYQDSYLAAVELNPDYLGQTKKIASENIRVAYAKNQRLPQLDLVALGIDDPGKLAVLGVIDLVEDVAAFRFERRDHSVKVFNAVVDHERGFAWSKLLAFLRTNGPDGRSARGLAIRVGPGERGTAPVLDIDGEMTLVPSLQRRCILCLEKDAADASDSLHVNLRWVVLDAMRKCVKKRANWSSVIVRA
jgi:hypothetical protein